MEAAWRACDAFSEMDRQRSGQVTRQDYFAAMAEAQTVAQLRMMRRARLDDRFQRSAVPLSLDEFLRLLWPGIGEEDLATVRHWAQLNEVRRFLGGSGFRGTEAELRHVFDSFDAKGTGQVLARDLVSAGILAEEELAQLPKRGHRAQEAPLDIDAFRSQVWPLLKARFITRETISRMKREEDAMLDSAFRMGLGATASSSGGT